MTRPADDAAWRQAAADRPGMAIYPDAVQALCILGPTRPPADIIGDIAEPRVLAALETLGWPDDRDGSAHVEGDGWETTPAGHYYELVETAIRSADSAGQPTGDGPARVPGQSVARQLDQALARALRERDQARTELATNEDSDARLAIAEAEVTRLRAELATLQAQPRPIPDHSGTIPDADLDRLRTAFTAFTAFTEATRCGGPRGTTHRFAPHPNPPSGTCAATADTAGMHDPDAPWPPPRPDLDDHRREILDEVIDSVRDAAAYGLGDQAEAAVIEACRLGMDTQRRPGRLRRWLANLRR